MTKIIPLSYDLIFKKVFGDSENIENLETLISIYFNIKKEDVHGNIEILNTEKRIRYRNDKRQAMDILIKLGNTVINIEVNNKLSDIILERNISYVSGLYLGQLKNKTQYKELEAVIQINFDACEIDDENEEIINKYYIQNRNGHKLTEKLQIHHVNIEKCKRIWYDGDIKNYPKKMQEIIKLGALMVMKREEDFEKCLEEIKMDDMIRDSIRKTTKVLNSDKEMAEFFFEHVVIDNETLREMELDVARKKAKDEGHKEESIEIAKKMLNKKLDIEIISELTGLSLDEIKQL